MQNDRPVPRREHRGQGHGHGHGPGIVGGARPGGAGSGENDRVARLGSGLHAPARRGADGVAGAMGDQHEVGRDARAAAGTVTLVGAMVGRPAASARGSPWSGCRLGPVGYLLGQHVEPVAALDDGLHQAAQAQRLA